MSEYEIRRPDQNAARRSAAEIAAQLDEHVRRHQQRGRPVPMSYGHSGSAEQGRRNTLTIHGTVYARTIHVGDTGVAPGQASPANPTRQALEHLLTELPQAGLSRRHERAVRKAALAALTEASAAPPRRRNLWRELHQLNVALITGIASGGANELAGELLKSLQHLNP